MALLPPRLHSAANIICNILFVGRSGNLEFTHGKLQSGVFLRAGLLLRCVCVYCSSCVWIPYVTSSRQGMLVRTVRDVSGFSYVPKKSLLQCGYH